MTEPARPGHGDHWLAALPQGDPRLLDVLAPPTDAPPGLALHRVPLTEALDLVQVTARRRLVTAFPEPRATALVRGHPKELSLWETRVEGWMRIDHASAGSLAFFVTDVVESAERYSRLGAAERAFELGALAYSLLPIQGEPGPTRLQPAARFDARFLQDDYWFEAEVQQVHDAGDAVVADLAFHGGLSLPVVARPEAIVEPGMRVQGFLWLTGRLPEGPAGKAHQGGRPSVS